MKIHIHQFHVRPIIGVYDWEKKAPQDVYINLHLSLRHDNAATTDKLADTLDYASVTNRLKDVIESEPAELIETLTRRTLDMLISYPIVEEATVEIFKPGCLPNAKSVSVEACRRYA